jgi:sugar lactone lactonase YvrE
MPTSRSTQVSWAAGSRTLVSGLRFPESLIWHAEALWFVDLHTNRVHTLDGASAPVVATLPDAASGIAFLPDGRMVAGLRWARSLVAGDPPDLAPFADLAGLGSASIGNMAVRADGGIYVALRAERGYGTAELTLRSGEQGDGDWIALVTPDGDGRIVADDLIGPFNLWLSPDGTTLIVDEARGQRLSAFDVAGDGSLGGRRLYADLDGRPIGGVSVDAEGGVWVGTPMHGEYLRLAADGTVTDVVAVEPGCWAVSCEHGGDDGRTLFMAVVRTTLENQGLVASTRDGSRSTAEGRIEVRRVDVPGAGWG